MIFKLPKLRFSKRQKFFLATVFLLVTLLFLRAELVSFVAWRFRVVFFAAISAVVAIWALFDEDFSGVEWVTLPVLPVVLSLGALMTFPLFPAEINQLFFWPLDTDSGLFWAVILKIVFLGLFAIGYYASLLTSNILNVAALRTIQLLRVAHSIGFLLTLLSVLLGYLVIYSLHLSSFWSGLATFVFTFPLVLQSIWSINLEPKLGREVVMFTLALTLIISELAWVLSFWPVSVYIFSLFLTSCFYGGVGVVQYKISGRLGVTHIRELVLVVAVFLYLTIFTTSWTG